MNLFSLLFRRKKREYKIGLALGSGGAKGFATLGALTAFEENGITFDVIGGTSIGSIIGAFYADGYSCSNILDILKRVDFSEITNLFMIGMDTSKLKEVIDRNIGYKNIEELKKPFLAVATELDSGEEKVLYKGSVGQALSASSSYPPFFKPVIIDGKRYIDGAFVNSVPADRVIELGADYVVGVDLSDHNPEKSLLEKIFPTYKGKTDTPWAKGYENCNVMIHPDLKGYKAISFKDGDEMFEIGYNEALKYVNVIKNDIEKLKKGKYIR